MSDARDLSPLGGIVQRGFEEGALGRGLKPGRMIEVARTLMKSEPELAELVAGVEGVEVAMVERGFGTRVELRARDGSGLAESDLEQILDGLAEPSKQPFASA